MQKAFHHAGKRAHLKRVLIKTFQLLSFLQYLHVAELWPSCCRRNMVYCWVVCHLDTTLGSSDRAPPSLLCVPMSPPQWGKKGQ